MLHSIFTVEVCLRVDRAPVLLEPLRGIVRAAQPSPTRKEASRRHTAAAEMLLGAIDAVERGCWEYFDDESRAKAMFDDWCRPLVDRKIPRLTPSGAPGYREDGARYLLFTMVYLLARDSPSDVGVRRACDVPAGALWLRSTFERVLGAARDLAFANVKSEAMYMIPRDSDWALTATDLGNETYAYLRLVQDG